MKAILIVLLIFPLFYCTEQEPKTGQYLGAIPSEIPEWFKESFLDFKQDVEEASAQNKRVMLYFHQDGCPYCAKLVEESFNDPDIKPYMQRHFDSIMLNMWGDLEVVSVLGQTYTEKEFARVLNVQYTPTVIFLDEQGRPALRLNGYYPPEKFRHALRYVKQKLEKQLTFNQYIDSLVPEGTISEPVIQQDLFNKTNDLSHFDNGKMLAVFFDKSACVECNLMHQRILTDEPTKNLVKQANAVLFNASKEQSITTPKGINMPLKQWLSELNISYYPSVVFFDEQGDEVMRIEAFIKTFHFQSIFDYVVSKAYLEEPNLQHFIADRGERIRQAGFNTDIWGYESFHHNYP